MPNDQRNLLLSLALAGTVVAGVTTTALVAASEIAITKSTDKASPVQASAFYKYQPSAAAADYFLKINAS